MINIKILSAVLSVYIFLLPSVYGDSSLAPKSDIRGALRRLFKGATPQELWNAKTPYNVLLKQFFVVPVLTELLEKGELGKVVLDVGSGRMPVSGVLPEEVKVVTLDHGGDMETTSGNRVHLNMKIEELLDFGSSESERSLKKIRELPGILSDAESRTGLIDTIILSEILNYVDYQAVLPGLAQLLNEDGLIFILNEPERGHKHLFSEKRPKNNQELKEFLERLNFEMVEYKHILPGTANAGMVRIIARKKRIERPLSGSASRETGLSV